MSSGNLWWERRRLWLPAAIAALVGILLLIGYRVALAGRLGLQARVVEERERSLAELDAARQETEGLVRRARATRLALDTLYGDRLGTQARRLTAIISEVKKLARQAGLEGVEAIAYTDEPVEDVPLLKKSIAFRAAGTYAELRSFVNLLEVNEAFLTLEGIRVHGEAGGGELQLEIRLSTLFATAAENQGGDT
jgi:Tfp pilus assembly protein PilO